MTIARTISTYIVSDGLPELESLSAGLSSELSLVELELELSEESLALSPVIESTV